MSIKPGWLDCVEAVIMTESRLRQGVLGAQSLRKEARLAVDSVQEPHRSELPFGHHLRCTWLSCGLSLR